MSLRNIISKIEKAEKFNIKKETIDIINNNAEFILELLRDQMRAGKDADNKPVFAKYGPYYADSTVFEKERYGVGLGKFTEWVTNYMSGNFYLSLKVITKTDTFNITSDVDYFSDIITRSGIRIMELSKENVLIFRNTILLPELQKRLNV